MARFTLLREDRFSNVRIIRNAEGGKSLNTRIDSQKAVRRPLLGMEHKQERYAVIRVISSTSSELYM